MYLQSVYICKPANHKYQENGSRVECDNKKQINDCNEEKIRGVVGNIVDIDGDNIGGECKYLCSLIKVVAGEPALVEDGFSLDSSKASRHA